MKCAAPGSETEHLSIAVPKNFNRTTDRVIHPNNVFTPVNMVVAIAVNENNPAICPVHPGLTAIASCGATDADGFSTLDRFTSGQNGTSVEPLIYVLKLELFSNLPQGDHQIDHNGDQNNGDHHLYKREATVVFMV